MRTFTRAAAAATALTLAAASSAPASPTSVVRSQSEGRAATASWDSCGLDGCFRTTATVTVGTSDGNPVGSMFVERRPQPLTPGVATRYFAGVDPDTVYVLEDLSAAGGNGEALIYSQHCTEQDVCHGASFQPLGQADVSGTWAATGEARRFQDFDKRDVSRLTFEECVYTSNSSGWRRPANASLVIANIPEPGYEGWIWPLGTPVSASISEFRSTSARRCKSPF